MAISGLVARGAQESLEQLLERQLLQEQLAAQTEARAASGERENRGLDLRERQFKADQDALERQLTQRESEQSTKQERGRFEATARQNMSELINDPTQLAAFSMASGVDVPAGVRDLTTPKKVNLTRVRTTGPGGKPIARGVTDEELAAGVEEYQEPKAAPSRGSRMWVLRDGQPVRVSEDDIQPGDEPYTPRSATPGGGPRLAAGAIEKVAGVDTALGSVQQIEAMLPEFESTLGPVSGRVAGVRQLTPGADEGYAEFAAEVNTLKNAVIKATTGAQMSEPEAKRIMAQVPDTTNQPQVFRARLATTMRNLETLKRRTLELSGGGGEPTESGGRGGPAIGTTRTINGVPARWDGKGWVPQ